MVHEPVPGTRTEDLEKIIRMIDEMTYYERRAPGHIKEERRLEIARLVGVDAQDINRFIDLYASLKLDPPDGVDE